MQQTTGQIPHDDHFRIPAAACDLAGFRSWSVSSDFPPTGRIDFLAGDLEVDMSPEDLYTHGSVKAEIGAVLQLPSSCSGSLSIAAESAKSRRLPVSRAAAGDGYRLRAAETDGWVLSPLLQRRLKLTRSAARPNRWTYRLVHREREA
jgi:hypothetical protein